MYDNITFGKSISWELRDEDDNIIDSGDETNMPVVEIKRKKAPSSLIKTALEHCALTADEVADRLKILEEFGQYEMEEEEDNMSEYKYGLLDFEVGKIYINKGGEKYKINNYDEYWYYSEHYDKWRQCYLYKTTLKKKFKLYKPKITIPDETLHFLKKYVDEKFKWLGKDKDGKIWAHTNRPERLNDEWIIDCCEDKNILELSELSTKYGLDTSFIKWEDEPLNFRKYIEESNNAK